MTTMVIPGAAEPRMPRQSRLAAVLTAPWFAGSRATRWWALGFFALMGACALAAGIAIPNPRSVQLAVFIYAFGAGIVMMWLACLLLVARDGWRLRLPSSVRNSAYAIGTYALALVAVPAIAVAAAGGHVDEAILFSALAITASLAYLLLPLAIGGALGFIPAAYIGLRNLHAVPSIFDPRFQHWAWLVLAILIVVNVIRGRQFLRDTRDDDGVWHRTMLAQMRGNMFGKFASVDQRWAWRKSSNTPTAVDFRNVDPGKPAHAIEVALGGWYVPQTLGSRVASLARVLVPVLIFIPLMLFMNIGHEHSLRKVVSVIGVSAGLWVGLFGGTMLVLMSGTLLQRRWKHHAGMALLALLPGIDAKHAGLHVARAVFTKPVIALVVLWLCVLTPALLLHSGPMALLLASLIMLGMAAVMVAAVLRIVAGSPLGSPTLIAVGVIVLVMVNVSAVLGIVTPVTKLGVWTSYAQWGIVVVWVTLIAWATWRALVAWRQLQSRPHPFMANAP